MTLAIIIAVAALAALLAIVTAIGAAAIVRAYPPVGRFASAGGGHLHVLEMGRPGAQPVVLLHGASGNLQDMRLTLGAALAQRHRVIMIDRPGHGWSGRPGGKADATPARQAALIAEALTALGVERAIIAGHSFAGSIVMAFGLDFPERVDGLVLLAPATHPWDGGIAWFYTLASTPVIGPLFARTIVLPAAYPMLAKLCRSVFDPQPMPQDYARLAAIPLLLRPQTFVANAQDVAALKDSVIRQSPRYGEIAAPTVIITGDRDTIVSADIHSRAIAATLPHAKLIVLPGIGHAVQHVAADIVVAEIDRLAEKRA